MTTRKLSQFCFVERLTLISWLVSVLPFLVRNVRGGEQTVFYIDDSPAGIFIARITTWCLGISIQQLLFRLVDIRDEKGNLIRLRITYDDLARFQRWVLENPLFQRVSQDNILRDRMPIFLQKQIASFVHHPRFALWRALFLIHVVKLKCLPDSVEKAKSIFFMDRRVWMNEIQRYAREYGVRVIPARNIPVDLKSFIVWFLGPPTASLLKNVYAHIHEKGLAQTIRRCITGDRYESKSIGSGTSAAEAKPGISPRISVEYYGHLNLDHPELHSELFFWQQSSLPGDDIVVTFNIASDPADEKKAMELRKYRMHAVALSPNASVVKSVPVFLHWPRVLRKPVLNLKREKGYTAHEKKWMQAQITRYGAECDYWVGLFTAYDIKVHLSWFKYSSAHCVVADALRHVGGVMAIYQRAFEELPSPETLTASDIVFGFSRWNADLERSAGSVIPYHVSVGYFGDHRFALLRKPAQEIRRRLKKNGAKYVLAFFDENSHGDSRWQEGHEFMRENYAFLLGKVLSQPWVGVVLKPKVASTLRRRLGPVAELLKRAEETGRCFVLEGGTLRGSHPPAMGALASDVAIHGHLFAGTAGVEAALAGVPTLLLDREGWSLSKLYDLGKGRVVFTDWESVWSAFDEYRNSNGSMTGFGDWSSLLDKIDPFRDGRAAERIGAYLKWLLGGFKAGLSRDTVMADAAERYTKRWGKDKITAVQSN
jgi:hypothetical protein